MNLRFAAVAVLSLAACAPKPAGKPCPECSAKAGAVSISFPLTDADVVHVTASVSGTGITTPLTQDLTLSGSPATASGTVAEIPPGTGRTITVTGFPAAPEDGIAIYRGDTMVDITAGQTTDASLTLLPVNGDVAVTAEFPDGDLDLGKIDHISVVVTGNRISSPATYYLTLDEVTATGTAEKIPVGQTRTVTVKSFASDGTVLHEGSAQTAVTETGTAVTVTMTNIGGNGDASVSVTFCDPSCGSHVCGDDGCGGSCGGCIPGASCVSGACQVPFNVISAFGSTLTSVTVVFSDSPTQAQAENIASYCIAAGTPASCSSSSPGITAAVLSGKNVTLTTAALQPATAYSLFVSGVTRASDSVALTTSSAPFTSPTLFTVTSAAPSSATTLLVTFSAGIVTTGAAVDPTSYCVVIPPATDCSAPALEVSSASVTGPAQVTLTTAAETPNASYGVVVTGNILRASDNEALSGNQADFAGFNLITNGSFEAQTGTTLSGWTTVTSLSAPLTVTTGTVTAHQGSNVAAFPTLTSSSPREAQSSCASVGQGSLTATGWVQTPQPVANTKVSFKLYWFTDATCTTAASTASDTQTSFSLTASSDWEKNTFTKTVPADATHAVLSLRASYVAGTGASTDQVFFDDVALSQ
jgi:hypothetical protein